MRDDGDAQTMPPPTLAPAWLEEITGDRASRWVASHNARTEARLNNEPARALISQLEAILDNPDRIPVVADRHGMLYNFWTDPAHPRGIWRRTTWEDYVLGAPRAGRTPPPTQWENLLDVDALTAHLGPDLSWAGASVLTHGPRTGQRALISLSQGGTDASTTQEYDLVAKRFLTPEEGGFCQSLSKGTLQWADDDGEVVLISDSFTDAGLSRAGYPRQVRRLRRGQDVAQAEILVTAAADAVAAFAARDPWGRTWLTTMPSFSATRIWLLPDDAHPGHARLGDDLLADEGEYVPAHAIRLDIPESCAAGVGRDWLTLELREPWEVGGQRYEPGTLLGVPLEPYIAGERRFDVLFSPTASSTLAGAAWTRNHLVLTILDDVVHRLEVCTPPSPEQMAAGHRTWGHHSIDLTGAADLPGRPDPGSTQLRPGRALLEVSARPVDARNTDYLWVSASGWATPSSLAVGKLTAAGELTGMTVVRQAPARYDARGVNVTQHVARSADGAAIPYFEIRRPAPAPEHPPVLVKAYGCFGHILGPAYEPVLGKAWLERGGVYVVANTRGGGEYGPGWHLSAIRQTRGLVTEDLDAVVTSLVDRGVAQPQSITVYGSSAGGLAVGDLLAKHPDHVGAAIVEMPLLDLQRYSHLLAGASWVSELGDPDDPEQWAWMRTLSPLHQLREGVTYPPVLALTSTRDDRVHPWHARALTYRLEELGQSVSFYETAEGGHHGAVTTAQTAWLAALTYTFAWEHTSTAH